MKPAFCISLGLTLACASSSVLATPPLLEETRQYDAAIADASHWGRLMYDHDQAAWKATDVTLKNLSDDARKRIRGWITEPTNAGIRVVFVGEENGKSVALYEDTPSSQPNVTTDSPRARVDS